MMFDRTTQMLSYGTRPALSSLRSCSLDMRFLTISTTLARISRPMMNLSGRMGDRFSVGARRNQSTRASHARNGFSRRDLPRSPPNPQPTSATVACSAARHLLEGKPSAAAGCTALIALLGLRRDGVELAPSNIDGSRRAERRQHRGCVSLAPSTAAPPRRPKHRGSHMHTRPCPRPCANSAYYSISWSASGLLCARIFGRARRPVPDGGRARLDIARPATGD
jgi:hypothetical protein